MAVVKAIPKSLLIHSIRINDKEYKKVRVEFTTARYNDVYGQSVKSYHLLFVDIDNTPDYHELKEKLQVGSKVQWSNKYLTVDNIEVLHGFKEHHMEVYLV